MAEIAALRGAAVKLWTALRRPLLVAFLIGCAVSMMTSGRLTLRLVLPATVYWSFVPLCEIGSLAVVARRRNGPFGELVDRYFESHTAWLVWVVIFASLWAWLPAATMYRWTGDRHAIYATGLVVFAWSAYLDFGFFRLVLERTPARAVRDLAIQRLLCWTAGLAIFVSGAGAQVLGL